MLSTASTDAAYGTYVMAVRSAVIAVYSKSVSEEIRATFCTRGLRFRYFKHFFVELSNENDVIPLHFRVTFLTCIFLVTERRKKKQGGCFVV